MTNNAPIGVFDSGLGGLSVLKNIYQQMPNESFIYLADSRYIPYGEKDNHFIIERCFKITNFFIKQHVKAIVIACNTATAAAANILRQQNPNLPIIAIEPAIKPAKQITKTGKVGVLATSSTIKSAKFADLLNRFATDIEVYSQPCPGLVECIERGDLMGEQTQTLLIKYLDPLLKAGCDTIILGCTHYPFLRSLLDRLLPPSVQVVESGAAVTRHLQTILSNIHKQTKQTKKATVTMYTTGDIDIFKQALSKLWFEDIASIQSITV